LVDSDRGCRRQRRVNQPKPIPSAGLGGSQQEGERDGLDCLIEPIYAEGAISFPNDPSSVNFPLEMQIERIWDFSVVNHREHRASVGCVDDNALDPRPIVVELNLAAPEFKYPG
jgi:hypothetical protein